MKPKHPKPKPLHGYQPILIPFLLFLVLITCSWPSAFVRAAEAGNAGLPGSPFFGYGARVDLYGEHVEAAINLLADLGMNWLAVDFDWARQMPDSTHPAELESLDRLIALARQHNLSVLLSITNPPSWALTGSGPDPELTTAMILQLVQRYPGTIQAIELFPGANTHAGWNGQPDPQAYLFLLYRANTALADNSSQVYIVPSLTMTDPADAYQGDLDDLSFLTALYQADAKPYLSILAVRYPSVIGNPMTPPEPAEHHVLRHYEAIRALMLNNNHQDGRIWITSFSWPVQSATHPATDHAFPTTYEQQAEWLNQAYRLLKTQLFIGAAFFSQVNPSPYDQGPSLLLPDFSLHPACQLIQQITKFSAPEYQTNTQNLSSPAIPILPVESAAQPTKLFKFISKGQWSKT